MPTAQGGGVEGPSVPGAMPGCPAWHNSAGTRSGSSWHLPCCEASTLQRGAGKIPSASPGQCPEPFLLFLGFFLASPSPGGGYSQPSQAARRRWQSMAVGASGSRLPAGATLGSCLKKRLALPKPKPTGARAYSWAPWEKNQEGVFLLLKRTESKAWPPPKGGNRDETKKANSKMSAEIKHRFSLISAAGKGSAWFHSLTYSSWAR